MCRGCRILVAGPSPVGAALQRVPRDGFERVYLRSGDRLLLALSFDEG
jgi:hypothetical protein